MGVVERIAKEGNEAFQVEKILGAEEEQLEDREILGREEPGGTSLEWGFADAAVHYLVERNARDEDVHAHALHPEFEVTSRARARERFVRVDRVPALCQRLQHRAQGLRANEDVEVDVIRRPGKPPHTEREGTPKGIRHARRFEIVREPASERRCRWRAHALRAAATRRSHSRSLSGDRASW